MKLIREKKEEYREMDKQVKWELNSMSKVMERLLKL